MFKKNCIREDASYWRVHQKMHIGVIPCDRMQYSCVNTLSTCIVGLRGGVTLLGAIVYCFFLKLN